MRVRFRPPGAGVFFHLIPVLEENGGGAIDVALAFTMPMGICEAASSLVIGRLIDRQLPPRYSTSLAPPT